MSDGIHHSRPTYYHAAGSVRPGMLYRHFKGGLYVVLGVAKDSANIHDQDGRKVHYMNLEDGKMYHRPLHDDKEGFVNPKIHPDGKQETKFQFIGYAEVTIDGKGHYHVTRKY